MPWTRLIMALHQRGLGFPLLGGKLGLHAVQMVGLFALPQGVAFQLGLGMTPSNWLWGVLGRVKWDVARVEFRVVRTQGSR